MKLIQGAILERGYFGCKYFECIGGKKLLSESSPGFFGSKVHVIFLELSSSGNSITIDAHFKLSQLLKMPSVFKASNVKSAFLLVLENDNRNILEIYYVTKLTFCIL